MPLDFVTHVEGGLQHLGSGGWLTPESVYDLDEADFVALPPAHREEVFKRAAEFRTIAEAGPNVDAAQEIAARAALERLGELLRPYRTAEGRKALDALWKAWTREGAQEWAVTFDYRLDSDWSGDPAVYVWLIFKDETDTSAPEMRAKRKQLELLIHTGLQDAGVDRWPYFHTRRRSEVRHPAAEVTV